MEYTKAIEEQIKLYEEKIKKLKKLSNMSRYPKELLRGKIVFSDERIIDNYNIFALGYKAKRKLAACEFDMVVQRNGFEITTTITNEKERIRAVGKAKCCPDDLLNYKHEIGMDLSLLRAKADLYKQIVDRMVENL